MPPRAVVFDIGNVLIEWQPERHYDAVIGPVRRKAMFEAVDLHGMNDRVDRGAPFKETIYETAQLYPEWRSEIRMWYDQWIHMAQPAIDRSVRLLRALRSEGVPVFALSNFGIDSFAYAQTQYQFLKEFDRKYISGHMATAKPDAEIYQMLEEDTGLSGADLLFADDRDENIDAAVARGWHGHLFRSPQGWAECLIGHGLLTSDQAA
ncbi:HAD family hydrolase [Algirhabdus cladophorae]|uniref:HAD family hydrolase n=1 Tax=Algirhabdus cladophorae TaxID=3377108 RepID=UPI003B846EC3